MSEKLAVCTVVENPLRWKVRYDNYYKFVRDMEREKEDIALYTVEIAFADRPFFVTNNENPYHLQLRTNSEIWHKENALNLLFQRVQENYIAWVDCDISFERQGWAEETVKLLHHYDVLQLFSYAIELGSDHHIRTQQVGYIYQWKTTGKIPDPTVEAGRSGYAWAARKSSLSKLGMLTDWNVVGGDDYNMAYALIGAVDCSLGKMCDAIEYKEKYRRWAMLADKHVQQNVGYLPGIVHHHWHGKLKNRMYTEKGKLLNEVNYIPSKDLLRDWQGLYYLSDRNKPLRELLRKLFRYRDDDSTEEERIIP